MTTTQKPPLSLHPISSPADFPPLIRCQRISYLSPPNALYQLFCPQNRPSVEESLAESTERQREWAEADPTGKWFKVTTTSPPPPPPPSGANVVAGGKEDEELLKDADGKIIIAGALWHVYEKSPGEGGGDDDEEMSCYWWPEEGGKRALADSVMGQLMGMRAERMRGACLLLEICYTHPSYRRLGAGNLMLEWGTAKADELGVEAFIEATADGVPLYERHGFKVMNEFTLRGETQGEDEGEELKKLRDELTWHGFYMWRPPFGKWVEGVTRPGWLK